jgi:hypothetical protein
MPQVEDKITPFVNFLVAEMEDTEDTTFVQGLLDAAKAAILGKAELDFIETGTVAGKIYGRSKELSSVEIAQACRKALSLYNDVAGRSPFTFPDFSNM